MASGTFTLPSGSRIYIQSARRYVVVAEHVEGEPYIEYRTDDLNRAIDRQVETGFRAAVVDTVGRQARLFNAGFPPQWMDAGGAVVTASEASRRQRLADAKTWGGYRSAHIARETGTLIVVVNVEEEGLDPANGECKWYTVCADHSQRVGHETLALATAHASNPLGWCEVCNGADETWKED